MNKIYLLYFLIHKNEIQERLKKRIIGNDGLLLYGYKRMDQGCSCPLSRLKPNVTSCTERFYTDRIIEIFENDYEEIKQQHAKDKDIKSGCRIFYEFVMKKIQELEGEING